ALGPHLLQEFERTDFHGSDCIDLHRFVKAPIRLPNGNIPPPPGSAFDPTAKSVRSSRDLAGPYSARPGRSRFRYGLPARRSRYHPGLPLPLPLRPVIGGPTSAPNFNQGPLEGLAARLRRKTNKV